MFSIDVCKLGEMDYVGDVNDKGEKHGVGLFKYNYGGEFLMRHGSEAHKDKYGNQSGDLLRLLAILCCNSWNLK